jgi:PilZ domain
VEESFVSLSAKGVVAAREPRNETPPAPRFLPKGTISVRLISPPLTDRRLVFGILSNISATGCCVIANRSLPENTTVMLQIVSRFHPEPLEVEARVVWCAERLEPMKEIVGYLTGVCFRPDASERVAVLLNSGSFQTVP